MQYDRAFLLKRAQFVKWAQQLKRDQMRAEEGLPPLPPPKTLERSFVKIIKSGNNIETYEYQKAVLLGRKDEGKRGGRIRGHVSDRSEENRRLTTRRARNTVRRLVNTNFNDGMKFLTLTFADPDEDTAEIGPLSGGTSSQVSENSIDIRNVVQTNAEFKKFIQRLRRYVESKGADAKFPYLAVIEFQDKTRGGVVHYHMIADLPYIPNDELARIWGNGFVRINKIKGCDNVGAYLTKYMMKDAMDERLQGKKCYLTSKGLKRPEVLSGEMAHVEIQRIEKEEKKKMVYQSVYPSEFLGGIQYKEYNMNLNEIYRKKRVKERETQKKEGRRRRG